MSRFVEQLGLSDLWTARGLPQEALRFGLPLGKLPKLHTLIIEGRPRLVRGSAARTNWAKNTKSRAEAFNEATGHAGILTLI